MKQYCSSCGAGTEYSLQKPKFCNSCGEAFASSSKLPPKRVFKPSPSNPVEIVQEEQEEEEFEMPMMDKLHFDLGMGSNMSINKIENIIGSNAENPQSLEENYAREADTTYSKENFAQDFLRDAGSSSRNNAET